jgi:hypothetical protein
MHAPMQADVVKYCAGQAGSGVLASRTALWLLTEIASLPTTVPVADTATDLNACL